MNQIKEKWKSAKKKIGIDVSDIPTVSDEKVANFYKTLKAPKPKRKRGFKLEEHKDEEMYNAEESLGFTEKKKRGRPKKIKEIIKENGFEEIEKDLDKLQKFVDSKIEIEMQIKKYDLLNNMQSNYKMDMDYEKFLNFLKDLDICFSNSSYQDIVNNFGIIFASKYFEYKRPIEITNSIVIGSSSGFMKTN